MKNADDSDATVLLGRSRLLQAIDDGIEAVTGGRSRALTLVGDPGIGKSALVRAAIERGTRRGLLVARADATELERDAPFGIVVQALDPLLAQLHRSDLADLGADAVGELAAVFPSLADARAEPATGLQVERFRFHHA